MVPVRGCSSWSNA